MRIISAQEALKNKRALFKELDAGAVFIYPTDTIYGIGCDAANDEAVKRIRKLKQRESKPFSIIAPSVDWIHENCDTSHAQGWLVKFPGPYTLILNLKKHGVCPSVNKGLKSIGVRIPNHWISSFVAEYGKPIVTTSVNLAGEPFATTREELERFDVDFIIFEGEKKGSPSTVVELIGQERIVRK